MQAPTLSASILDLLQAENISLFFLICGLNAKGFLVVQ
jgi:hypothetical protein